MVAFPSRSRLRPRPIHILAATYGTILSALSIIKVFEFNTQSYDMAIFNQVFWNTLHGNFMFSMPECCAPANPPSFLGAHFSPLILLLLPIYALYQSPYTLLVIQSFALALPVVFIYKIASKRLGRGATWAIVAAYLLYPGILWPSLSDFHLEAFVPLAYVMVFYFWEEDRRTPFLLSFMFLLSIYEYAPVIGLSFLLYAWLKGRRSHTGKKISLRVLVLLGLVSVAWYAGASLVMQFVWPQRGTYLPSYWSPLNLGVDIVPKAGYWATLLVTLAFAPLAAPLELITAAPWFLASVFSNFPNYYTIPWQYSALVSGPLVIAAIFALQRLQKLKFHRALAALAIIGLVGLSPFGAYAMVNHPSFVPSLPGENAYAGHQAISVIPANATVLAQDNVLPFLVDRSAQVFSNFPKNSAPPDYIAIDVPQKFYFLHDPPDAPMQQQVSFFLSNYSYGLVASADGFLVYELGYRGQLEVYVPYMAEIPVSDFGTLAPLKQGGSSIYVPPDFRGLAWNGPWDSLGPGEYRVTFFVDNLSPNSSVTLDSVYYADNITFAEKAVSFPTTGQSNASLDITLTGIIPQVEFRGSVGPGQSASLDFESVEVSQISAP
jgi:uncharacterized membrane protein